MTARLGLGLVGLLAFNTACGPPPVPEVPQHTARCGEDPNDKERPMVVEWSAADRAALEAEAQHGIVVVAYTADENGCNLRVLSECSVQGGYEMTSTTPARDFLHIKSEDELRAQLPLAAARFGGEVRQGNELRLDYVVVGQNRASLRSVDAATLTGQRCEEATHFVRAMILGASTLSAMSEQAASAEASAFGAEASGSHEASSRELRTNGNLDACEGDEPGTACRALIQLDLTPLRRAEAPAATTAGGAQETEVPQGARVEEGTLAEGDATLRSGEYADNYPVQVEAGGSLDISLSSSDFDTYLIVRDANGAQRDNDDDPAGGTTNSALSLAGLPAGTYTVVATSYQPGQTGAYRLVIGTSGGAAQAGQTTNTTQGGQGSNFGTIRLAPGFTPDPHTVRGVAGGSGRANALSPNCTGWISGTPDHIFEAAGDFRFLRMYVEAESDTTLVVQTPSGQYGCNDDRYGVNPALEGPLPAGTYRVWVGSYRQGQGGQYNLSITELNQNRPSGG